MENQIYIQHHFLFETGVFEKYPMLFDIYAQYNLNGMRFDYRGKKASLGRYEKNVTWPAISGPGFWGATNPGAGKSFNGIMTGLSNPVYNSDALYINPALRIFAVSDSPGVTTLSRDLFKKMDRRLNDESINDLEKIIRELGYGIAANKRATLALICFTKPESHGGCPGASVFIAGDTCVYRGNVNEGRLARIDGMDHFWGTSHRHFKPEEVPICEGDFFIIASDGIDAINRTDNSQSVQDALFEYVKEDPENFAVNVTAACNGIFRETFNGRGKTVLGGYDDITSLLVFPHLLADTSRQSYILGGKVW